MSSTEAAGASAAMSANLAPSPAVASPASAVFGSSTTIPQAVGPGPPLATVPPSSHASDFGLAANIVQHMMAQQQADFSQQMIARDLEARQQVHRADEQCRIQMDVLRQENARLTAEVASRDAAMHQLVESHAHQRTSEMTQMAGEFHAVLGEKADQVKYLESLLDQQAQRVEATLREVEQLRAEATTHQQEHAVAQDLSRARIAELQQAVIERDAALQEKTHLLTTLTHQCGELRATIADKDRRIGEHARRIAELEVKNSSLQFALRQVGLMHEHPEQILAGGPDELNTLQQQQYPHPDLSTPAKRGVSFATLPASAGRAFPPPNASHSTASAYVAAISSPVPLSTPSRPLASPIALASSPSPAAGAPSSADRQSYQSHLAALTASLAAVSARAESALSQAEADGARKVDYLTEKLRREMEAHTHFQRECQGVMDLRSSIYATRLEQMDVHAKEARVQAEAALSEVTLQLRDAQDKLKLQEAAYLADIQQAWRQEKASAEQLAAAETRAREAQEMNEALLIRVPNAQQILKELNASQRHTLLGFESVFAVKEGGGSSGGGGGGGSVEKTDLMATIHSLQRRLLQAQQSTKEAHGTLAHTRHQLSATQRQLSDFLEKREQELQKSLDSSRQRDGTVAALNARIVQLESLESELARTQNDLATMAQALRTAESRASVAALVEERVGELEGQRRNYDAELMRLEVKLSHRAMEKEADLEQALQAAESALAAQQRKLRTVQTVLREFIVQHALDASSASPSQLQQSTLNSESTRALVALLNAELATTTPSDHAQLVSELEELKRQRREESQRATNEREQLLTQTAEALATAERQRQEAQQWYDQEVQKVKDQLKGVQAELEHAHAQLRLQRTTTKAEHDKPDNKASPSPSASPDASSPPPTTTTGSLLPSLMATRLDATIEAELARLSTLSSTSSSLLLEHQVALRVLEYQQLNVLLNGQLAAAQTRIVALQSEVEAGSARLAQAAAKRTEQYESYAHSLESQVEELRAAARHGQVAATQAAKKAADDNLLELHEVTAALDAKHAQVVADLRQQLRVEQERIARESTHRDTRSANDEALLHALVAAKQDQIDALQATVRDADAKYAAATADHALEMKHARSGHELALDIQRAEKAALADQLARVTLELEQTKQQHAVQAEASQTADQRAGTEMAERHRREVEGLRAELAEKAALVRTLGASLLEKDASIAAERHRFEGEILPPLLRQHEQAVELYLRQIADGHNALEALKAQHEIAVRSRRAEEEREAETLHSFLDDKHRMQVALQKRLDQLSATDGHTQTDELARAHAAVRETLATTQAKLAQVEQEKAAVEGELARMKTDAAMATGAGAAPSAAIRDGGEFHPSPSSNGSDTPPRSSPSPFIGVPPPSLEGGSQVQPTTPLPRTPLESPAQASTARTHALMVRVQELYDQVERFCARDSTRGGGSAGGPIGATSPSDQASRVQPAGHMVAAGSPQGLLALFLTLKSTDLACRTHLHQLEHAQLVAELDMERLARRRDADAHAKQLAAQETDSSLRDEATRREEERTHDGGPPAPSGPPPPPAMLAATEDFTSVDASRWPLLAAFLTDAAVGTPFDEAAPTIPASPSTTTVPAASKGLSLQQEVCEYAASLSAQYAELLHRSEAWRVGHTQAYEEAKRVKHELRLAATRGDIVARKCEALQSELETLRRAHEQELASLKLQVQAGTSMARALDYQLQQRSDGLLMAQAQLWQVQADLAPPPLPSTLQTNGHQPTAGPASSANTGHGGGHARGILAQVDSVHSYLRGLYAQLAAHQNPNVVKPIHGTSPASASALTAPINLLTLEAAIASLAEVQGRLAKMEAAARDAIHPEETQLANAADTVGATAAPPRTISTPTADSLTNHSTASGDSVGGPSLVARLSQLLREQEKRSEDLAAQVESLTKAVDEAAAKKKVEPTATATAPGESTAMVSSPPAKSTLGVASGVDSISSEQRSALLRDFLQAHAHEFETARTWRSNEHFYQQQLHQLQQQVETLRHQLASATIAATAAAEAPLAAAAVAASPVVPKESSASSAVQDLYDRQAAAMRAEHRQEVQVYEEKLARLRVEQQDLQPQLEAAHQRIASLEAELESTQRSLAALTKELAHVTHTRETAFDKQTALEVEISTKLLPRISELESLLHVLDLAAAASQPNNADHSDQVAADASAVVATTKLAAEKERERELEREQERAWATQQLQARDRQIADLQAFKDAHATVKSIHEDARAIVAAHYPVGSTSLWPRSPPVRQGPTATPATIDAHQLQLQATSSDLRILERAKHESEIRALALAAADADHERHPMRTPDRLAGRRRLGDTQSQPGHSSTVPTPPLFQAAHPLHPRAPPSVTSRLSAGESIAALSLGGSPLASALMGRPTTTTSALAGVSTTTPYHLHPLHYQQQQPPLQQPPPPQPRVFASDSPGPAHVPAPPDGLSLPTGGGSSSLLSSSLLFFPSGSPSPSVALGLTPGQRAAFRHQQRAR